jgi:signal transduction histidine kinase
MIFVFTLSSLLAQSEQERERELKARQILAQISLAESLSATAILDLTSHLEVFLQESDFNEKSSLVSAWLKKTFDTLHILVKGHKNDEENINRLEQNTQLALYLNGQANDFFKQGNIGKGYAALMIIRRTMEETHGLFDQLVEHFDKIVTAAPQTQATTRHYIQLVLAGAVLFNILIALALAAYFNRGTTSRLNILMDNTIRLSRHKELNPPVTGSDEVSHLDQVFHSMAADLANAERAKQEYVAMISHDLRSPLTSIKFVLAMVNGGTYGAISENGLKRVKGAESNAERLISLINTLLDLEKMEAGKLEMNLSEIRTSDVIDRSVEAVFSLAELMGIKIETPQNDRTIIGDSGRLVQVLVNLLSNAIKFSPRGSAVTIAVEDVPGYVELRIIDRGRGIPASHINAIFDRFQQVEESDAKERGGTGLGLAICKAIIEGHGGTIGIESELGKGSTFWFRIPVKSGSNQAEAACAIEAHESK